MAKSKSSNDKGWQITAYIAIAVIVVSLLVIGVRFTGHVVQSTGIVNVSVDPTAAINFTTNFINFGNGSVILGQPYAVLESNVANAVNGSWAYSAQNFTLENIGNINVSLQLKTNKDAAVFIGGTNPEYQYNVTNTKAESCTGASGVTLTAWNDVNTTDPGTTICPSFGFASAYDQIQIDVRLLIPSDSKTGNFTDTFTVTGTAL